MKIITTSDGSSSLYNEELDEHYHSVHGAIQESLHVFIKNGLHFFDAQDHSKITILEVGFGTGLNCLLTLLNQPKSSIIQYTSLEVFPLSMEIVKELNYTQQIEQAEAAISFEKIHAASWEQINSITTKFELTKRNLPVHQIEFNNEFDLVYYDAFGPRAQPDMWSVEIFEKIYTALKHNGILVTYCAKGDVKRMLKSAGFIIEALPGPPGKREMTKATKR